MLLTEPPVFRHRAGSGLLSLLLHGGAATLLLTLGPSAEVRRAARHTMTLIAPLIAPYIPARTPPTPRGTGGGGGGGGDRSLFAASKGMLPHVAPRQFVPPAAVVHNESPKLLVEPTIVAPPDAGLPNVNMAVWGDPLGKIGPPSNGTGSGGGIGSGVGGGVGSGKGPGYGPGEGGGVGGGIRGGRGSITNAVVLKSIEPEYTDDARKAKIQGTVAILIDIDTNGRPANPRVRSGLGFGLDDRAMEAVLKWRFRPYLQNGVPISGPAVIEVRFRLL